MNLSLLASLFMILEWVGKRDYLNASTGTVKPESVHGK